MTGRPNRPLPDRVQNLVLPALMLGMFLVLAAVVATALLSFGLAWGLLTGLVLALIVAGLLGRFGDDWGLLFTVLGVPAWAGIVFGVIAVLFWWVIQ